MSLCYCKSTHFRAILSGEDFIHGDFELPIVQLKNRTEKFRKKYTEID